MIKNIILAVLAIVVLGFGVAKLTDNNASLAGGTTNFDTLALTGLQLGSSGTSLAQIVKGTCNLVGGTIAATSTGVADCAVTGVVDGDLVFASLATSSAQAAIAGARASSTSGFITVKVMNLSGVSKDITAFGTSTAYLIVR